MSIPAREPLVHIVRVTKKYGDKTALSDVTLTIRSGDFAVLAGSNGAGKTTLLKVIGGLLRPLSGEVRHFIPSKQRWFIPDDPPVQGNLTVRENLMYAAMVHDLPKEMFETRMAGLLRRYGLWEAKDAFPGALSHGMERKVGICMGLLVAPRVLLADEPFSGLDAQSLERLAEDMGEISRQGGAVLVATHQFGPVKGVVNRVLEIQRGEVRETRVDEVAAGPDFPL